MRSVLLNGLLFLLIQADDHEYRLYKDLMTRYNPLERPVINNSHALTVTLALVLQQIVGVVSTETKIELTPTKLFQDEKNQIMETNVWLKFSWTDYKLKWNPAEYGGINDVRFPAKDKIWKPDVLLYNSADTNFDTLYPSNLVVYHDGQINWIPPGILKSCKIDITWFPFDDQSCYLKFGSWTYHGYALNLKPDNETGMDLSEYLTNGEWTLLCNFFIMATIFTGPVMIRTLKYAILIRLIKHQRYV